MAEASGIEVLTGVAALVAAVFLFGGAAYSMFIRMRIPKGKYSVIFPFLTVGSFLLAFMMIAYSVVFFLQLEVVTYLTTILFFLGTIMMMVGAYKVTLEFGEEETRKAEEARRARARAKKAQKKKLEMKKEKMKPEKKKEAPPKKIKKKKKEREAAPSKE